MKGKMEEDQSTIENGTWEQALKWAADCKREVAKREETPWTWKQMQNGLRIARQKEHK